MSDFRPDDDWIPIGEITLLQIQKDRLTGGDPNVYDPEPLAGVDALAVSASGVSGRIDGGWMLDVHHLDHAAGHRFTPDRALSFGFTSHYGAMATRFGSAPVGIAGENVVVTAESVVEQCDLAGGIRVVGGDGRDHVFDRPKVAAPCAMFTRFLRRTPDAELDEMAEDRAFLHAGMRGYIMRVDRRAGRSVLRPGDHVLIRASS